MLHWGILLACFVAVSSREQTISLGTKWTSIVKNTEDPNSFWSSTQRWILMAEPGSTITAFCPDFRLANAPPDSCKYSKVVFDDGQQRIEKCGSQRDTFVKGRSSKMTIDLIVNGGGGFVECLAKAYSAAPPNVEVVDITLGLEMKRIYWPAESERGLDQDRSWRFRSTTSHKLSLQCDTGMERALEHDGVEECIRDILTIDAGEGPKKYCGGTKIVVISTGTEINMRMETYPTTNGHIECRVQAISGPHADEYKNDQSQPDDSSEHGVVPGRKSTTCPCGMANRESGRIFNGTEVPEGKYPFMVSMRYKSNGGHFCGASILTPLHILTAAHCVSNRNQKNPADPSTLMPTVGVNHRFDDASHGETQKLSVKQVIIPDNWFAKKGSLHHDIAILVLETPIKFSKWVSPVCLTPNHPPMINKYIKAMGWGQTESTYPIELMESNVRVLDKALCNDDPSETCFKTGPSTTCFGDSGGPYVYVDPETNRYTQVSLVSYVYGACTGKVFVGTNVIFWYDWIQKTIAATSGERICQKL